MDLFYNKILSFIISIFAITSLIFTSCVFAYGTSGPDVWVIDSTYHNHGQTVSNIIRNEAPNANVHFEAISNSERVSSYKVAQAIYKAADSGADVINLSLGAPQMSSTLANAIRYAQNKGTVVVAAAGNDGRINYPAAYEGVVSVGAIDPVTGQKAYYSSPGEIYASGTAYNGMQGTSFAAPKIAGRIAQTMSDDNIDSRAARKVVIGNSDARVGTSTPELVKKDVLLDLLFLAWKMQALDSFFPRAFADNERPTYRNNGRYYSNPVFCRELRGFDSNSFFRW